MYALTFGGEALWDPADGQENYLRAPGIGINNASHASVIVNRAAVIVAATFTVEITGVVGSSETVSVYASPNMATSSPGSGDDNLVGSSTAWDSATRITLTETGMSVAVAAGGDCGFRWTNPTWVTNPTQVSLSGVLFLTDNAEEAAIVAQNAAIAALQAADVVSAAVHGPTGQAISLQQIVDRLDNLGLLKPVVGS